MVETGISPYDEQEIRCPMLGHLINFAYCRSVEGRPCRRIVACWEARLDIQAFLAAHYTPDDIARITAPPPPKVNQLLALIEKARHKA